MPTDPLSRPDPDPLPALRGHRRHLAGWPQWVAGAVVLAALAGVSMPVLSETAGRANRSKTLAQAKQVALALKLFAGDNDGDYPKDGVPVGLRKPTTSNAAFAVLFPTYVTSEMIFGDELSAYQTRKPDNKIGRASPDGPDRTLEAGENALAYMMGLIDADHPAAPLVMDGTDGTGHYTSLLPLHGGAGVGVEAIVIRLDNSGKLEPLSGPANARYVPLGSSPELVRAVKGKADDNLLDPRFYGKDARLLDPAIDLTGKP